MGRIGRWLMMMAAMLVTLAGVVGVALAQPDPPSGGDCFQGVEDEYGI